MKKMVVCFLVLGSVALCELPNPDDLQVLYFEDWNNPAKKNNYWFYVNLVDGENSLLPSPWHPNKGIDYTPHIKVAQSSSTLNPLNMGLAFTFGQYHPINLLDDNIVEVYVTFFPYEGGGIGSTWSNVPRPAFWVGQIDSYDHTRASIFLYDKVFYWDSNAWWLNRFTVLPDPNRWQIIRNDLNLTPAQILANPEMYGFWFDGGADHTETWIGLDNFLVLGKPVPEPATAVLLGLGLLAIKRHRMR